MGEWKNNEWYWNTKGVVALKYGDHFLQVEKLQAFLHGVVPKLECSDMFGWLLEGMKLFSVISYYVAISKFTNPEEEWEACLKKAI